MSECTIHTGATFVQRERPFEAVSLRATKLTLATSHTTMLPTTRPYSPLREVAIDVQPKRHPTMHCHYRPAPIFSENGQLRQPALPGDRSIPSLIEFTSGKIAIGIARKPGPGQIDADSSDPAFRPRTPIIMFAHRHRTQGLWTWWEHVLAFLLMADVSLIVLFYLSRQRRSLELGFSSISPTGDLTVSLLIVAAGLTALFRRTQGPIWLYSSVTSAVVCIDVFKTDIGTAPFISMLFIHVALLGVSNHILQRRMDLWTPIYNDTRPPSPNRRPPDQPPNSIPMLVLGPLYR